VIAAYRANSKTAVRFGAYDEHYIANPMLASSSRPSSMTRHFASQHLEDRRCQSRLREISVKIAWAGLPTPLLHSMGINIDKDELDFSMGDYWRI